jgi:hypothetical protein
VCGAGTNFHLDKHAGKNCDITSYSTDYEPIKLVPIINALTAYTRETTGETIILLSNYAHWYGKRRDMSQLKPNPIRSCGITIADKPTR